MLNQEFLFYWYILKQPYKLESYNAPRIGYSRQCKSSHWEIYNTSKNFDYYFTNKRNTYISRKHYKNDFVDGYIYGRYPIKNPLDIVLDEIQEEEIEREF